MKTRYKLCVIPDYAGMLPIRNGINGPIHRPSKFTLEEVVAIINHRIKIYEVNYYNKKEKVLLTMQNVAEENFLATKDRSMKKVSSFQSANMAHEQGKENSNSHFSSKRRLPSRADEKARTEGIEPIEMIDAKDTVHDVSSSPSGKTADTIVENVLKPDFF